MRALATDDRNKLLVEAGVKPPPGKVKKRILESLATDYAAFVAAGLVTSNAKKFNNVIRPQLLPIPVEDVCIPPLHLDLGIFPYIFYAFLDELRCIDCKIAALLITDSQDSEAFKKAVSQFQEVIAIEQQIKTATEEANMYAAQVGANILFIILR